MAITISLIAVQLIVAVPILISLYNRRMSIADLLLSLVLVCALITPTALYFGGVIGANDLVKLEPDAKRLFDKNQSLSNERIKGIALTAESLIEQYPDNNRLRYVAATARQLIQDYRQALSHYEVLLEDEQPDVQVFLALSEIKHSTAQQLISDSDWLTYLHRGVLFYPESLPLTLSLAIAYELQEQWQPAILWYQTFLENVSDPESQIQYFLHIAGLEKRANPQLLNTSVAVNKPACMADLSYLDWDSDTELVISTYDGDESRSQTQGTQATQAVVFARRAVSRTEASTSYDEQWHLGVANSSIEHMDIAYAAANLVPVTAKLRQAGRILAWSDVQQLTAGAETVIAMSNCRK